MLLNEHLIEFLTEEDDFLIREHGSFGYSISQISTYKNEHGKIYNMAFDVVMGARINIDENLYAVIDYYSNPSKIRLNRDFSGDAYTHSKFSRFSTLLEYKSKRNALLSKNSRKNFINLIYSYNSPVNGDD